MNKRITSVAENKEKNVPFKRDTWQNVDGYGDAEGRPYLCEICGTPVAHGSQHPVCYYKQIGAAS